MLKAKLKQFAAAALAVVILGSGVQLWKGNGHSDVAQAAKLSGELTVYTAIEEELIPEYIKSFQEKYPDIKLKFVRDSTGVISAKLLSEGKNTSADVVWGLAASSLLALDKKQMLKGYTPKGSDKILAPYKDKAKQTKWVGNTAFMTGIVVNTAELKKRNLPTPKSYADLAKPQYKELVVMPHPASSGTGFLTVSAWLQMMGDKKAWSYMDQLNNNIAMYTHSGSKPAKLAGAGEFPIGVSLVYSGVKQVQNGAPVEVVLPKEGLGWDVEANALINKKDMKDEAMAKVFLDWAITNDVMKKYYDANGFSTMKNSFPLPKSFPGSVQAKMYAKNDLNWAAQNRDRILKAWDAKYGKKAEPKN